MKFIKMLIIITFATFFLVACGSKQSSQETVQGTAEAFVQALIDADEKTLKNLNRDETNPTDHLLSSIAPKFSDLKIEDITFELDKKKNEVLVEYKGEETIRYWLDVEKIGDKYFVTKLT
ncbi:hypothetical protein HUN92_13775 [Bacillus firmus]|uniref:hypothetical protein n=1 Tax=Cytobacillus firmus TaxID=1399 RepID=UPI0015802C0A|nr:hypothetical protein [Cytobacillus firmus]NUH84789.1 hypothetical protein [Cytobacillus firmus]